MFEGNSAGSGGAIYALNEVSVSFNMHILFFHNTARANGGAIYAFKADIAFHPSTTINILGTERRGNIHEWWDFNDVYGGSRVSHCS